MSKLREVMAANRLRFLYLGLAILVNVAAIGAAVFYQREVHTQTAWVAHTRAVLKLLAETRSALLDAETGQRGYALTGEDIFIGPYDRAVSVLPAKVSALREMTADNPAQQVNLSTLETQMDQEMSLLLSWRNKVAAQTVTPAETSAFAHDGKSKMDEIRATLGSMVQLQEGLYNDRLLQSDETATAAETFLLIGGGLSLGLIALIFYYMQRDMVVRQISEESLSVTLRSIGDGVIATDSHGTVTMFNRAAEEMSGWSEDKAIGRPIDQVFHIINEETRKAAVIPVTEVLETGKAVGLANHTVLIARDGRELAIADSCAPIHGRGGERRGAVLVFRDVTEERKTEIAIRNLNESLEQRVEERTAALWQSEERFSAFMDASPVIAWVKDERGFYQYMNKACCDIFGLQDGEWRGKTEYDVCASELAEAWRANDRSVLDGGRALEVVETVHDRNGNQLSLKSIKFAFRGIAGERFLGGVATDITRQLRVENQLRQAQKMEAVGQLTGGLAHDFNNLLAVVIGNLDYVIEKMTNGSPTRTAAQEAQTAALRGADLTRQLLSFSRQQTLQPRLLDINPLVQEMSKLLKRTLGEAIDIRLDLATDLWPIKADPSMLESALMNLAVNARDAMPKGGKLIVKSENCHFDEDYTTLNPDMLPGDYICLSVSDTGTGMSPDVIARAFDPFFTTKAVGHGSGLGLSMVHGFARQSGGNVKIYSEIGLGSTINLYLPRLHQDDGKAAMDQPAESASGAGEIILVVEDNPAVLQLVSRQLGELGYDVMTAPDGPTALSTLRGDQHIDLLFTDVVMAGGMSGPDLAKEARRLRPGLRVLFSSGFPREAGRGNIDFEDLLLSKPYRRADLAHKVREVLDATG